MYFFILILLQSSFFSYAQKQLIRDYFLDKNVRRVVGFSCDNTYEIFETVRMLNKASISASIKTPQLKLDFSKLMQADSWKLGVFLDIRCSRQNTIDIIRNASNNLMFGDTYNWLILSTDINKALKCLNDSTFSMITDVVISVENDDRFDFYDVYNICKYRGGSLIVTKYGQWQENIGLNVTLVESKIQRRWNLQGLTLRMVTSLQLKPNDMSLMEFLEDESTKPNDVFARLPYSLMKHLPKMFNFTPDISAFVDWKGDNDTMGPIIRALQDKSVDFSFYTFRYTPIRSDMRMRVLAEIMPLRTCFIFRTTRSSEIKISTVLGPLDATTWYFSALVVLIMFIFFSLILRLENLNENNEASRWDTVLLIIASLCQQGFPFESDKLASRIAFLQITIFGLLLYNYYSAAIVSVRLNDPIAKINDSLYSLVNSNIKLAAEPVFYFNFFLTIPDWESQYFAKYWTTQVPDEQKFVPKEEGLKRMAKGGLAYHIDPNYAYPYINRHFDNEMICQLTEVHLLQPTQLTILSTHDGQFNEITKIGLLRMTSAGLLLRQQRHWMSRAPFCREDILAVESVTIYETAPIIILLLCGIVLSLVIFFIEIIIYRFTHYQKQYVSFSKNEKKY